MKRAGSEKAFQEAYEYATRNRPRLTPEQSAELYRLNEKMYNLYDKMWLHVHECPTIVHDCLDALEGYLLDAYTILEPFATNQVSSVEQDIKKIKDDIFETLNRILKP